MIPINVTHLAIVTKKIQCQLLAPTVKDYTTHGGFPIAETKLRQCLSTAIAFFADAYKTVFGFNDGPPLHDALTIAYVSDPTLFKTKRYRVDVELTGAYSTGETVVDVWNYRNCDHTWGTTGKNCRVAESLEVSISHDL